VSGLPLPDLARPAEGARTRENDEEVGPKSGELRLQDSLGTLAGRDGHDERSNTMITPSEVSSDRIRLRRSAPNASSAIDRSALKRPCLAARRDPLWHRGGLLLV